MPTDPVVAWLIALVVATIYGWIMHRRGFARGSVCTFSSISAALQYKKVMEPQQLIEHMADFGEALIAAEEEE